jgi:hypothetical protein
MAKSKGRKGNGEGYSGFFRPYLKEHPELLNQKSNTPLIEYWKKMHPDQAEIPPSLRQNLANLKSNMRKKLREAEEGGKGRSNASQQPAGAIRRGRTALESLEEAIDECMTSAKNLDRDGLATAINLLRRARNEVVWKIGQD